MKLYALYESLDVTDAHISTARGNKMHFLVNIPAKRFLILTTPTDKAMERIMSMCKTTDEYNEFAHSGENLVMPNLVLQGDLITGHEGRHRAASLLCKDPNATMTIALRYRPRDKMEARKLYDKYGSRWEYEFDFEDVPDRVTGQFGRGVLLKKNLEFIENIQKN